MPKLLETNKSEGEQEKAPSYLAGLQSRCSGPKKDKRFWLHKCSRTAVFLPGNEATHPNIALLIPNNSVWNREFAKPCSINNPGGQPFHQRTCAPWMPRCCS